MVKLLPPGSSYDILLLRSLIQVHIIYDNIMDILLDDSFTTTLFFADAANASSGDSCRGRFLWLRRLEHKVGLCPKMKSRCESKAMFDFLVQVESGGSGSNGGLPSSVCDAGSLKVPLSQLLHMYCVIIFL